MAEGSTVGAARRSPWGRAFRFLCALVFASLSLVLVTEAPSFAAPAITLNKSAPADVLVGGSVGYTLHRDQPGLQPGRRAGVQRDVPRRAPGGRHVRRRQHVADGVRRAAASSPTPTPASRL